MNEEQSTNNEQPQQAHPIVTPYIEPFGNMNPDLIKIALDPRDILDEVRMRLLGMEWDDKNQEFIQLSDPMISKVGVDKIIIQIAPFVYKNMYLSELDDDEIRTMIIDFENTLTLDFFYNWEKYWDNERIA